MYIRWQRMGESEEAVRLDGKWRREALPRYSIAIAESYREPGRATPRRRTIVYLGSVDQHRQQWAHHRRALWERIDHRLTHAEQWDRLLTAQQVAQFRRDLEAAIPRVPRDALNAERAPALRLPAHVQDASRRATRRHDVRHEQYLRAWYARDPATMRDLFPDDAARFDAETAGAPTAPAQE